MATFYSNLIAPSTDALEAGFLPPVSTSRMRYRHTLVPITLASPANMDSGDEIRLMTFKSTDRIVELFRSSIAVVGGGAATLGISLTGANHDGAAVDADLFGNGVITVAARADIFAVGAADGTRDRAKTLWELLDEVGPTSYGVNPNVLFDLTLTLAADISTAGTLLYEVNYISGD